jgi:hypothetical protein
MTQASDEVDALFRDGTKALSEGRVADAIATFEALADRGVLDATTSYDRGLAYASRVRIGAEVPGDLGRAAQGLEEARAITSDPKLADDATRALAILRAEVARRRGRSGDAVELDQGPSLGRSVAHLVAEDAWASGAAVASVVLGAALFVRWLAQARRARVAGTIAAAIAAPALVLLALLAMAMRDEREHRRDAVVVVTAARPVDERGITVPSANAIPEAALVEIVAERSGFVRVRWGSVDAWVSATSVRTIAPAP